MAEPIGGFWSSLPLGLNATKMCTYIHSLQNEVQLRCTLFRHIATHGGMCMTTSWCSEGGILLATGLLSNSSTNLYKSKLCLSLKSFVHHSKCRMFYKLHRCLGTCLKTISLKKPSDYMLLKSLTNFYVLQG